MKNLIVFGANKNCISKILNDLNWDNYGVEFEILAFFDNSKTLINTSIERGYYYPLNKKKILPISEIKIDSVNNISEYRYDYIYIAADAKNAIMNQLLEIGVPKEKILINTFCLQTAYLFYPDLGTVGKTFDEICPMEIKENPELLKAYIKNLKEIESAIIGNSYKKRIFQIQINAINAYINREEFGIGEFKYSYKIFAINPSLFFYECMDIVFGSMDEEIEEIYFNEGPYEMGHIMLKEDDIVIDAGANYGLFTVVAAKKAKNGRIYAFEPIEKTREILLENISNRENVVIVPKAISDKVEKVKMDIADYESNPGSAMIIETDSKEDIEEVEAISIDYFVSSNKIERIDFIKADIEGAERKLLMGAKESLKKFSPKLSICTYHNEDDPSVLEKIIREANPDYIIEHQFKKLYAWVLR